MIMSNFMQWRINMHIIKLNKNWHKKSPKKGLVVFIGNKCCYVFAAVTKSATVAAV